MSANHAKTACEIDEALLPLASFVQGMTDVAHKAENKEFGMSMSVESMKVNLPIEMDILVDEHGQVEIGGAPPVHRTETSVQTIYHQLKLNMVQNHGE